MNALGKLERSWEYLRQFGEFPLKVCSESICVIIITEEEEEEEEDGGRGEEEH